MKTSTLVIAGAALAWLLLRPRPVQASVTTSETVELPNGTTITPRTLDPIQTVDRTTLKNAVDLLMWK